MEKVSQSLAGRSAVLHLLPFTRREIERKKPLPVERLGSRLTARESGHNLIETLFTGFYPRIHDKNIPPRDWLSNYYRTYLERDARMLINVGDLETFGRFIRLCAGRNGQLLNLSSLAADCGVNRMTAKRWLSVLEASFLVMLLRPHHRNFNKRLVKSPKLYFLDTGLLCFLLGVRTPEELRYHAMRGAVFETLVVTELYKTFLNQGEWPRLYFWRDSAGHEVDIIIEQGEVLLPLEVKSGATVAGDSFTGLEYWRRISGKPEAPACLVYGGDKSYVRRNIAVCSWSAL